MTHILMCSSFHIRPSEGWSYTPPIIFVSNDINPWKWKTENFDLETKQWIRWKIFRWKIQLDDSDSANFFWTRIFWMNRTTAILRTTDFWVIRIKAILNASDFWMSWIGISEEKESLQTNVYSKRRFPLYCTCNVACFFLIFHCISAEQKRRKRVTGEAPAGVGKQWRTSGSVPLNLIPLFFVRRRPETWIIWKHSEHKISVPQRGLARTVVETTRTRQ